MSDSEIEYFMNHRDAQGELDGYAFFNMDVYVVAYIKEARWKFDKYGHEGYVSANNMQRDPALDEDGAPLDPLTQTSKPLQLERVYTFMSGS